VRLALLTLLAALLLAAPAAAQRTSLPDIEDEVMCVECGTVLSVSNSPVAQQERDFIRRQVAAGKSKEQIKAALVAQYGSEVLAEPRDGGFDAASWAVPAAVGAIALVLLLLAVAHWRRKPRAPQPAAAGGISASDARRLDDDLKRYD